MDVKSSDNVLRLCGVMAGRPVWSHSSRGIDFYTFPLEVRRLSGTADRLNLLLRRELLEELPVQEREKLLVEGELRSFNNHSGVGARLVISVYVHRLTLTDGEDSNRIELCGTLCRPPKLRRTPLGREICDLMLAVGRRSGRSDYLPCICWGLRAREAARWETGDRLHLVGRVQSRAYLKLRDGLAEEKTAFEVSAAELEKL